MGSSLDKIQYQSKKGKQIDFKRVKKVFQIEQSFIKKQFDFFQKRKSFSLHIFPIYSFQVLNKGMCSGKLCNIQLEIPQTFNMSQNILDCLIRQQKMYVLLIMLYGYGQLYRYYKKSFIIKPQMIKVTENGKIFVWINSKIQKNNAQFLTQGGQIKMVINILGLFGLIDQFGYNIGGFIDTLVFLKKKIEQQFNSVNIDRINISDLKKRPSINNNTKNKNQNSTKSQQEDILSQFFIKSQISLKESRNSSSLRTNHKSSNQYFKSSYAISSSSNSISNKSKQSSILIRDQDQDELINNPQLFYSQSQFEPFRKSSQAYLTPSFR